MKMLRMTLFMLSLVFDTQAQHKIVDSLITKINNITDSPEKVDLLNTLTLEYNCIAKFLDQKHYTTFSKVFKSYQKSAQNLAQKIKDVRGFEIAKLNLLIYQGSYHVLKNESDLLIPLGEELLKKSQKLDYKQGMGMAHIFLASKYINQGNHEKRLEAMYTAAQLFKESGWKVMEGQTYLWNSRLVDLKEGVKLIEQAYHIAKEINNTILATDALLRKGEFYSKQGDFPKALDMFNQCFKMQGKSSPTMQKARIYFYTCELYMYQDNYQQAKKFIDQALKHCHTYHENTKNTGKSTLGWYLQVAGKVYSQSQDFKKGKVYLEEALEIFENINSNTGIIMTKAAMALSDINQQKYQQARKSLEAALPYLTWYDSLDYSLQLAGLYTQLKEYKRAEETYYFCIPKIKKIKADKLLMNAYQGLYRFYKSQNKFPKALFYHEKFLIQKEKILGIQKTTEMAGLRFQSQIDQQAIENTKLKQINTLKEAQLHQRDLILYISLAGIVLLLSFAYVLIRSNQQKKKANLLLSEQKEEIATQRDHISQTLEELKTTQTQLVQSEKMASLGQLTAGIAHEINNPINYVYAGIDSLKLNIEDLKDILEKAEELIPEEKIVELEEYKEELEFSEILQDLDEILYSIKNGASRTKEIVKGLRTFSRLDEDALKEIDIHENIDSTLLLLQNQTKDRVAIEKQYDSIPNIRAYPGPLNQVFMNILANALQAIEGQGSIYIKTQKVNDETISIRIRDTGKGIDKSVINRIFEPFFTTKDVGEGKGLGLSISHSIIEKHKGQIEVESEVGKGTIFDIFLPINKPSSKKYPLTG